MHPRNKYKHKKPDFIELAKHRPALQPYLIFKGPEYASINFQDPSALRELACALLECDFNLKLEIPLDRLIPTIPLRLNYVHWIEDLLMNDDGIVPSGNGIHGIDIGVCLGVHLCVCVHICVMFVCACACVHICVVFVSVCVCVHACACLCIQSMYVQFAYPHMYNYAVPFQ